MDIVTECGCASKFYEVGKNLYFENRNNMGSNYVGMESIKKGFGSELKLRFEFIWLLPTPCLFLLILRLNELKIWWKSEKLYIVL